MSQKTSMSSLGKEKMCQKPFPLQGIANIQDTLVETEN